MSKLIKKVSAAVIAAVVTMFCGTSVLAAGTDARAYVQDGLVFHWDAIDNVDYGVHSNTTNIWKNLVGTDATTDWKLNAGTTTPKYYTWTDRGLVMNGQNRVGSMTASKDIFANAFKAAQDGKVTIEFVYANAKTKAEPGVIFGPGFGGNIQLYTSEENYHVGFYGSSSKKYGYAAELNATNAYSVVYEVNTSGSSAGKATGNNITFTVNGKAEENAGMVNYCNDYMGEPVLGGRTISRYVGQGTLMAIRIYNRELTAAERTRNNDLDQYRFVEGSRIASYEVAQGSAGALQGTIGFYAGDAGDEVWLVSDTEDKGIKSLDDWGSCEKVDTLGAQAITKPYSFAAAGATDRIYRFAVKSSQSGFVAFTDATTVEAWATIKKTEVTDDPDGTTAELAITIDNCGRGCDKCDVYVAWGKNDFVEVKKGAVFGETVSYKLTGLTGDGAVSYRVKTVNQNKEKVFDYSFWYGFAWHYDATAKTITDGSNWVLNATWKPGESEITVTGCTSGSGDLDLRDFAVETDGVSSMQINKLFIGDSAFLKCGDPDTSTKKNIKLTSFRATKLAGKLAGAFGKCKCLTNLEVSGEGVTELGYDASTKWGFAEQCTALKTIKMDFPNLTTIGTLAFGKCTALEMTIDKLLPTTVTNIGVYAFCDCAAGGKVCLPKIDAIDKSAFLRSGVQDVEIGPNGDFTEFVAGGTTKSDYPSYYGSQGVFEGCASLTNVIVNAKSCTVNLYTFNHCSALERVAFNAEGAITMTTKSSSTESLIFEDCQKLADVSFIAKGDITLGAYVFYGLSGLKGVTFNTPGAISLGDNNFSNCSAFERVTLGTPSAIALGTRCFYVCPQLKDLTLNASGDITMVSQNIDICAALTNATLNALGDIKMTSSYNFSGCLALANVTLNASGAINLGMNACQSSTALANVTLNASGDITMGEYCFYMCSALKNVTFNTPGAVKMSSTSACFGNCSALTSLVFTGPAPTTTVLDQMLTSIKTSNDKKQVTIYASKSQTSWTARATTTNATEAAYAPAYCFGVYRNSSRKAWLVNTDLEETVTDDAGKEVTVVVPAKWMVDNEQANKGIDEKGANDLPLWKSYVLGLKPNDANSKPIVTSVQTANADTMTLTFKNFVPVTNAGVDLWYQLGTGATTNEFTWGEVWTNSCVFENVPLPNADEGVKYYRMKVRLLAPAAQ